MLEDLLIIFSSVIVQGLFVVVVVVGVDVVVAMHEF